MTVERREVRCIAMYIGSVVEGDAIPEGTSAGSRPCWLGPHSALMMPLEQLSHGRMTRSIHSGILLRSYCRLLWSQIYDCAGETRRSKLATRRRHMLGFSGRETSTFLAGAQTIRQH
jgi:hypothetical protein